MEPLTHEESLKLENSKAHLRKVLGDIADVNSLLETSLERKRSLIQSIQDAERQLGEVKASLAAASSVLEETKASAVFIEKGLAIREAAVSKGESKLAADREAFKAEQEAIKEENQKTILAQEGIIRALEEDIDALHKKLADLDELNKKRNALKEEITTLTQEKSDLDASHALAVTQKATALHSLDQDIDKAQARLADLQAQVEAEVRKLDEPRKAIKKEEALLARKLRDFLILKNRLEKHFKILLPDLSIDKLGLD